MPVDAPTGLTAIYGDTLADVSLEDKNPAGNTLGTWAWKDDTTEVGTVGSHTFKADFTPTDTTNYNSKSNINVTVTVGKADPTATAPTATATYGQTLADVTLTNPTGNTAGTWAWADATTTSVGDVGSHTFKANFTPTDTTNYNSKSNVDVTVTVGKADNPATVTGTASVTAGGNTADLADNVTMNGATGDVSYVISGEANGCSLNCSVLTSGSTAGTVTVNVTVATDANYNALAATPITVTINEKTTVTIGYEDKEVTYSTDDISIPLDGMFTIPADAGAPTYSVENGTVEGSYAEGKLTVSKCGTFTVTVNTEETATHKAATASATLTMNKANGVAATVTANTLTYDGTEQALVTVDDSAQVGGEMQYALGTDATTAPTDGWSETVPAKTDAGTYYVWYKLESNDNYNGTEAAPVEVSIAKRSVTLTSATASKTYDATALTDATVTVTGDGFATGEGATYDVTGTQTQAGESKNTFTYTLNNGTKAANYEITKVEGTLKVEQVDSSGEVTAVSGLVYDGTEKALVDSKVHGGIFMYRLGTDGEWTEEIPEAADFGTYTVYYYIKGDGNHKDNGSKTEPMGSVDVTIKCPYSNEWVDGKWYNKNGTQTYKPLGDWKKDGKDWMYVDTSGWYPKNRWQKIDSKWYFFDREGHMLKDAYQKSADGKIWYVGKNGAWDEKAAVIGWKQDSKGWWYGVADGWYAKSKSYYIDGVSYKFDKNGICTTK